MNKKVSIVLCTYNGEKYLEEQMESIINQTYPIYEWIVQDDCSQDGTMDIIRKYEKEYPFIHAFQNERQKGINGNFFSAITKATGDYIAISDQDDIWEPDKIERQVATIGDALLSAGISKPFSGKNDQTVKIHNDTRVPNIYLERMIYTAAFSGHTMMFRKKLLDKLPDMNYWSSRHMYDHLLQMIAGACESISYCPFVLVNHRRHSDASTYTTPLNYERSLFNMFRLVFYTIRLYKRIYPEMRRYFTQTYNLLNAINTHSQSKQNALQLCAGGGGVPRSFVHTLKLPFICVRFRDKIFYTKEKNTLLAIGWALYFPISCSVYFRYMDKSKTV